MTLDEAIKHAEEVAEQNEWFEENYLENKKCKECAEEHRQLAEWLKELKQLREQEPCEDAISRKEVFETFGELLGVWGKRALMEMPSVTPKTDVLVEIRTEIEQLPTQTRTNWNGCCPDIDYPEIEYVDVTKHKLLSIIDKYRAESEDK